VKFSAYLPTRQVEVPELCSGEGIAAMAAHLEEAGFDACAVTDHPFPSDRFLANGGHHALDPLVTLTWAASATRTLRLHTNVYVLPYRNPFLTAKGAGSLDLLSGGRLVLGVGAGYLRSEFRALGADFDRRRDRLEEGLVLLRRAWTERGVIARAPGLVATGNTMLPPPAQQPHPPIWVGGNSRAAIRLAVDHGQGWAPFETGPVMAGSARTAALCTVDQLVERLCYLHRYAEQRGRSAPIDICLTLAPLPAEAAWTGARSPVATSPGGFWAVDDLFDRLAAHGVGWVVIELPRCGSPEEYAGLARRFAERVVARHR
jgi:probable F420-dependent oxidoreductase